MYSTEQLLDMLNKRLDEYNKEAEELEKAADKSPNPSEYRLTEEYIKNRKRVDEKINYINNVIINVVDRNNNMQSIDGNIFSNLRDKSIIKNVGVMQRNNGKRLERLKRKNGVIEEKQRIFIGKKYNRITKRIEKQAEISSELERIYVQGHNTINQIATMPNRISDYKKRINEWRSIGIFGIISGKKIPKLIKETLVFGYTVGSYVKNGALYVKLLGLDGKRAIYEELNRHIVCKETEIINNGKIR